LRGTAKLWMFLDGLTVFTAGSISALYQMHAGPITTAKGFWNGTLVYGRSMGILLGLLCGFTIALIIISQRFRLYAPVRLSGYLNEQKLSMEACVTSGLLLTGTLYLIRAQDIPRTMVVMTLVLVTVALSLRRLFYRMALYRNFDRGMRMRNVLIVGNGPEAHALRHHLESIQRLGYKFMGFVDLSGIASGKVSASGDVEAVNVADALNSIFEQARKQFVDEIFFTASCEREVIEGVLERARANGVDLRVILDLYGGLAWNGQVEDIGEFPTIPLHNGQLREGGLVIKRLLDIGFASMMLILMAPVMAAIALAIRLDSAGPILYISKRVGKKGMVFTCMKFRTMVEDAESRRADVMHMNERDQVLFKIKDDPRVTRLGRFLRKYSLDELPQFINVLLGEMSVVGPRPPLASEVREYKLSQLRRLDVTPGITGLWQVQARRDPSFDSYVSLDVAYIENWSIWLDIRIIIRTVGVVLAGTGF